MNLSANFFDGFLAGNRYLPTVKDTLAVFRVDFGLNNIIDNHFGRGQMLENTSRLPA